MSRTDKDTPYWYAKKYKADHYCSEHQHVECDLPKYPIKHSSTAHHVKYARRVREQGNVPPENWTTRCTWEPSKPEWTQKWWQSSPPKWYRDHVWNNRERTRMRGEFREALKDYNANMDIDKEIQSFQHRHNAIWLYW